MLIKIYLLILIFLTMVLASGCIKHANDNIQNAAEIGGTVIDPLATKQVNENKTVFIPIISRTGTTFIILN